MPKKTKPMQDLVDLIRHRARRMHLARRRERHKELLADHLLLPKQEKLDKMRAKPKKYKAALAEIAKRLGQFIEAHPAPSKNSKKMDAEQTKHFENQRESLEKISQALQNPTIPDAETAAKQRLAPSEQPLPYGTLEWYRNELAMAQNRIQLLEDERDWLMTECKAQRTVIERVLDENVMRAESFRGKRDTSIPDIWREYWDTFHTEHPDWLIKRLDIEVSAKLNCLKWVKCTPGAVRMVRQRSNHKKSTHRA